MDWKVEQRNGAGVLNTSWPPPPPSVAQGSITGGTRDGGREDGIKQGGKGNDEKNPEKLVRVPASTSFPCAR